MIKEFRKETMKQELRGEMMADDMDMAYEPNDAEDGADDLLN